ncbi:MAG: hypothetical protein AAF757_23955, partial [Cyanobacteria bacterium P01_D01_bin.116]
MIYLYKKRRWLYISLSFLSLLGVVILPSFWNLNPANAYEQNSLTIAVQQAKSAGTNPLEQGRNLYRQGRFAEAANIW